MVIWLLFSSLVLMAECRVVEYYFDLVPKLFEKCGIEPRFQNKVCKYSAYETINGQMPGPTVLVAQGDNLRIHVTNYLLEPQTIHFHGFLQKEHPYFDGVLGLTQCGIAPNATMTYDLTITDPAGSYWYHSHATASKMYERGIYGPIIVLPPDYEPDPTNKQFYTLPENEKIIFITDVFAGSSVSERSARIMGQLTGTATRDIQGFSVGASEYFTTEINGHDYLSISIDPQYEKYIFHIICGSTHFSYSFQIGQKFAVIATDGYDMQPILDVDAVLLSSGERFDIEFKTTDISLNSDIIVKTLEDGVDHSWNGKLVYNTNFATEPNLDLLDTNTKIVNCFSLRKPSDTCIPASHIRSATYNHYSPTMEAQRAEILFLTTPVHGHWVRLNHDFDYLDGAKYIQHVNPETPPTSFENLSDHVARLKFKHGDVADFYIMNYGIMAHPMHIHGYRVQILDMGFVDNFKECYDRKCLHETPDIQQSRHSDGYEIWKDTFLVPAGGWVVFRLVLDNPGWWFAHCHIGHHYHDGMGFVIYEEADDEYAHVINESQKIPLENTLPECTDFNIHKNEFECNCYHVKDMIGDQTPREHWLCSSEHLCRHDNNIEEHGIPERSSFNKQRIIITWLTVMLSLVLVYIIPNHVHKIADIEFHGKEKVINQPLVYEPFTFEFKSVSNLVLKNISAKLFSGQVVAVVGGSGHGKTTLLTTVLGVNELPSQGNVTINGVNWNDLDYAQRSEMYTFLEADNSSQEAFAHMSCKEVLLMYAKLRNFDEDHVNYIMELTCCTCFQDALVRSMSTGEKRRLLIACNILYLPPIIVLDEPCSGLDHLSSLRILQAFQTIVETYNILLIMTVHCPTREMWDAFDKVILIDSGERLSVAQNPLHPLLVGHGDCKTQLKRFSTTYGFIDPMTPTQSQAFMPATTSCYVNFTPDNIKLPKKDGVMTANGRISKFYTCLLFDTEENQQILNYLNTYSNRFVEILFKTTEFHDIQGFFRMVFNTRVIQPRGGQFRGEGMFESGENDMGCTWFLPNSEAPLELVGITRNFKGGDDVQQVGEVLYEYSPFGGLKGLLPITLSEVDGDGWESTKQHSRNTFIEEIQRRVSFLDPKEHPRRASFRDPKEHQRRASFRDPKEHQRRASFRDPKEHQRRASFLGPTQTVNPLKRESILANSLLEDTLPSLSPEKQNMTLPTVNNQHNIYAQTLILLENYFMSEFRHIFNVDEMIKTIGLGLISGILWFRIGSDNTDRGLRYQIGFLFYMITLWTFTPLYPAIAEMWKRKRVVAKDVTAGLYGLESYALATITVDSIFGCVWPFVYGCIALTIAEMGTDISSFIAISIVLSFTQLAFISLGYVVGTISQSIPQGMIFGTIWAQASLIVGGFYAPYVPYINWFKYASLFFYPYVALLNIEYNTEMTYECEHGDNILYGTNSCRIEGSRTWDNFIYQKLPVSIQSQTHHPGTYIMVLFLTHLSFRIVWYLLLQRAIVYGVKKLENINGETCGEYGEKKSIEWSAEEESMSLSMGTIKILSSLMKPPLATGMNMNMKTQDGFYDATGRNESSITMSSESYSRSEGDETAVTNSEGDETSITAFTNYVENETLI